MRPVGDNTVRELRRLNPESKVLGYFSPAEFTPRRRKGDDPAPVDDVPPSTPRSAPASFFECTCGWRLKAITDVDAHRDWVRCGKCAGIAVLITR